MIITEVMDEIGEQLNTIDRLRVLPYEADDIDVPAAIVSLPASIDYLVTYARGMHQMTMLVTILVSLVDDRIRRSDIAPYADGTGDRSIKWVLENHKYTACNTLVVRSAVFSVISIAKNEYLGVVFTLDIAGPGNRP